MKLNCDMGESFGAWTMGKDDQVMPHVHMANVACGFHAADPMVMTQTVALAKAHAVTLGAHPSYPDLSGFGRRNMACSAAEITAMVIYQVGALEAIAQSQGVAVSYVKPHGALYNQMMAEPNVLAAVMEAVVKLNIGRQQPLALVVQAGVNTAVIDAQAKALALPLEHEAFLDRAYRDNGLLVARSQPGAVITDPAALMARLDTLLASGEIISESGNALAINPTTLCVHGDSPASIALIAQMRQRIDQYQAAQ